LIPKQYFDKLFLCNKFYEWAHKIAPRKYNKSKYDHPRLVIPFYDETGKVFAYQGRAFGNETPKYVTIKLDENKQKIYGLERVNFTKHIYVTEGPLDSLFLDNCIAAGGADLTLDSKINPEKVTYIFDNEPRNKEIIQRMEKIIDLGYNIFIWPEDIQLKDVNDLIMTGVSKLQLDEIISINTYSKLSAKQALVNFKKI
jgi:DNA primase